MITKINKIILYKYRHTKWRSFGRGKYIDIFHIRRVTLVKESDIFIAHIISTTAHRKLLFM